MTIMVVTISLGSAVALGMLTWVLWNNLQKQQRPLRILTGVIMVITGLAALLSGICGLWMVGA